MRNVLYVQEKEGGFKVEMTFDIKAVIGCSFNNRFYPFDSNMCKVQLGSYSYPQELIFFKVGENGLDRFNLHYPDEEYSVKLYPLFSLLSHVISFSKFEM